MIELAIVLKVTLLVDPASMVQVAVQNAATIKDLAAAVYLIVKARQIFRKTRTNKK